MVYGVRCAGVCMSCVSVCRCGVGERCGVWCVCLVGGGVSVCEVCGSSGCLWVNCLLLVVSRPSNI